MTEKTMPGVTYLTWMGIALIVLGLLAIAAPAFAGEAVMVVIGIILLVSGIFEFGRGWREDAWSGKILAFVLGVLMALCGLAVLSRPLFSLAIFTLMLAMFFVVEGIWKIVISFSYRPATGWLAMLASGVLGFLLGFLIWRQWPLSGIWAVGVLIGVDLLMTGISMVALALTVKRIAEDVSETIA